VSGLVAQRSRQGPCDPRDLERALAAAPHRGSHTQIATLGQTAIGISWSDDRDAADLVEDPDGLLIAVAGSIDNLDELRAPTRGGPDSEGGGESQATVVGRLYRIYGAAIGRVLRGAFAIAISDGRRLTCLRDQLGSRPLFYRGDANGVWVASEAKQVVAAAGIPREPDLETIEAIFYGHREDSLPAAIRGVRRLPKASTLVADSDRLDVRRYWDPAPLLETLRADDDELRERFDTLMTRAVSRLLRGDDILALSGGIDSPTIALFAADLYRQRFERSLPVLSMVFPDFPTADETPYIEALVAHLGLDLHSYQPPVGAQSLSALDRWTDLTDGPWMGWWEPGMDDDRYRRIRALGRRNYLTGDFAEYDMAIPFDIVSHLIWRGRFRALGRQLRSQATRGVRTINIARQVASAFLPGAFFSWYRGVRRVWPVPEWLDPARLLPTNPTERLPPWQRWRHHQLGGFLGAGLPFEAYHIFNESQGVAVRWPWADVDLWEFFVSLPAEQKFPGAQPKALVRRFIRGRLPDSVVNRRARTVLDEFVQSSFDYPSLLRWIETGDFRMPGVDYGRLRRRLEQGRLENFEYESAKDVAQVHAFLSNWSSPAGTGRSASRRRGQAA
jgi:asparagine synthase (glutamine-hydrolysing)